MKKFLLVITLSLIGLYSFSQQGNSSSVTIQIGKNYNVGFPNCVCYEIFVRSFCDSNGDGIGDINGITSRLDYLKELGIEAIWLTPFNPSPTYHKYDVTDYYAIDAEYGTLEDMRTLITEAHNRNIKIIMDLVINHCSSEHPWFKEACKSETNAMRNFFVWKKENELSKKDQGWHYVYKDKKPVKGEKYYGFFWGGMPDLNFDNPNVRSEIIEIGKYWLGKMGMDGFRLDAAKWIFPPGREKDNYIWWQEFTAAMRTVKPDAFFLGEITDNAASTAPYLQNALTSVFNFDLGFKIIPNLVVMNDSGIVQLLNDARAYYQKQAPNFVDATFLTNHDQNRIGSDLQGDISKMKLAASVLLTLPGTPFIYYGEEIGMLGKKPDENIREPFLWDEKDKDDGQCSWIKAEYSVYGKVTPLKEQKGNQQSLYNHYKRLIQVRNHFTALRLGEAEISPLSDMKHIIYTMKFKDEKIIVVHNLADKAFEIDPMMIAKGNHEVIFADGEGGSFAGKIMNIPAGTSMMVLVK